MPDIGRADGGFQDRAAEDLADTATPRPSVTETPDKAVFEPSQPVLTVRAPLETFQHLRTEAHKQLDALKEETKSVVKKYRDAEQTYTETSSSLGRWVLRKFQRSKLVGLTENDFKDWEKWKKANPKENHREWFNVKTADIGKANSIRPYETEIQHLDDLNEHLQTINQNQLAEEATAHLEKGKELDDLTKRLDGLNKKKEAVERAASFSTPASDLEAQIKTLRAEQDNLVLSDSKKNQRLPFAVDTRTNQSGLYVFFENESDKNSFGVLADQIKHLEVRQGLIQERNTFAGVIKIEATRAIHSLEVAIADVGRTLTFARDFQEQIDALVPGNEHFLTDRKNIETAINQNRDILFNEKQRLMGRLNNQKSRHQKILENRQQISKYISIQKDLWEKAMGPIQTHPDIQRILNEFDELENKQKGESSLGIVQWKLDDEIRQISIKLNNASAKALDEVYSQLLTQSQSEVIQHAADLASRIMRSSESMRSLEARFAEAEKTPSLVGNLVPSIDTEKDLIPEHRKILKERVRIFDRAAESAAKLKEGQNTPLDLPDDETELNLIGKMAANTLGTQTSASELLERMGLSHSIIGNWSSTNRANVIYTPVDAISEKSFRLSRQQATVLKAYLIQRQSLLPDTQPLLKTECEDDLAQLSDLNQFTPASSQIKAPAPLSTETESDTIRVVRRNVRRAKP